MIRSAAAAALVASAACAGAQGSYVWIRDYAAQKDAAQGYIIAPGDLIQVRVFNQEGMSAKVRVRSDGKVTLPFLNDVDAAGYPPGVLAQQLQTRFKDYVNLPVVTVSLEEPAPLHVSVVGEVARPGLYTLDSGARVLEALAQSGGLTEFAHKDRVFVLRGVPPVRVRFSWEMLQHGDPPAAAFRLRTGDAVVVE
jgi:polysaccharide export outer membrane protein